MTEKWKNYGDIDYLTYGGCMVKPHWAEEELKEHPELSTMYDVFYLNTEAGENGNELLAALCTVDISDSWINKEEILYAIGLEEHKNKPIEEILTPEQYAKEVVEYYGVGNFGAHSYTHNYPVTWDDYILTEKELLQWMNDLGIPYKEEEDTDE